MPSAEEAYESARTAGECVIGWKVERASRRELLLQFPPRYKSVVADHVTLRSRVAEDDDTAYVHVGARDMYRLELSGVCHNIDWAQRIAIRARGGGSWVCRGHDAELVVPSPVGTERCLVTDVTRLSEAEVQAYRERRRKSGFSQATAPACLPRRC